MRIERLDLLCFGCFKEKTIDFPSNKTGLHIIYGPNEAGKSTALSAIEDLLFGIPKNSSYNFLYDNKDLRIGAIINGRGDNQRLTFRRRKGNKDTIIDENETPLSDALLANFLQGVDRPFFERMFSLGHERLRKGGQEILDEKDDVGRMLFSASSGLLGLAKLLTNLEENADSLWSAKKSKKRRYYQGQEICDEAERRKKEATFLARNWKENRDRLNKVSEELNQQNLLFSEKTAVQERLQRIRRTLPYLVQIKRLEEDILKIDDVSQFSENASEVLEVSEKELNQADATLKILVDQISEVKNQLEKIEPKNNLLFREKDIKKLENDCAVVDKHERDIPNRQAEIETLENKRNSLVAELGWVPEKIIEENFFPQTLSIGIESLVTEKGLLETRLESTNDVLLEAEDRCKTIQQEIDQLGEISEAASLEAVIRGIRGKGELSGELKRNQEELSRLKRKIENGLNNLTPWNGSVEELTSLTFPQVVTIQQYEQKLEALKDSKKEVVAEEERLQEQLNDRQLEKDQLLNDKQAIDTEQLEEARKHRNKGWEIIRRKYLEGDLVSDEEIEQFSGKLRVNESYEKSVNNADVLADNRFTHAKETAQLSEVLKMIKQLEQKLETTSKKKAELEKQEGELEKQWHAEWLNSKVKPLSPMEMLSWVDRKSSLLDDYEQRLLSDEKEKDLKLEIEDSRNQLIQSMEQVGQERDQIKDIPLHLLLEKAETIKSELDKKSTRLEELKRQALTSEQRKNKAKDNYDKGLKEKSEWEVKWKEALSTAGFPTDATLEDVSFFLTSIKEIKDCSHEITKIRTTRIEAMKRDINKFHDEVVALAGELNIPLVGENDKETVYSMVRFLEEERNKKSQKETQSSQLKALEKRNMQEKENREKALAKLQPLLTIGKTKDISVLRGQIVACDRLRDLEKSKNEQVSELIKQGDGKNREELEKESENQDADQVNGDLAILKSKLKELNETLQKLSEEKKQATINLETIIGKADAASAEADKQLALTDMGIAAEGYVRSKTAAILLRWGMEKFRKEKQAPLLERASTIFKILTLGKFLKLSVELDDNDSLYLAGINSEEMRVGVEGMSDGTVDQLYLALRLAAIEEYVQNSQPLPFIADDLFINFDDNRAVAGFKALSELSQKTQILFFTHHEHLISVAKQALSSDQYVVHNL